MNRVELIPVPAIPLVKPGDDLASLIMAGLAAENLQLQPGDALVLAQKIVSKSEGRLVNLKDIAPSKRAVKIGAIAGKDPRHVQVILNESREVIVVAPGVFVVETHHGFVCANAGVDRSNIEQPGAGEGQEWLALLPEDPDLSAANLQQRLKELSGVEVAVVINDTHGRPFRMGGVGIAIGSAGLETLVDRRGESDMFGYKLQSTLVATGDELASAASLVMGQASEATPVVLVRGFSFPHPLETDKGAAPLVRPKEKDLFRYPANRNIM